MQRFTHDLRFKQLNIDAAGLSKLRTEIEHISNSYPDLCHANFSLLTRRESFTTIQLIKLISRQIVSNTQYLKSQHGILQIGNPGAIGVGCSFRFR